MKYKCIKSLQSRTTTLSESVIVLSVEINYVHNRN